MNKPNLDKDKKLIIETLRKLKNSKDLGNFLDDLLTEEEILDLAQRIKIGKKKKEEALLKNEYGSYNCSCYIRTDWWVN